MNTPSIVRPLPILALLASPPAMAADPGGAEVSAVETMTSDAGGVRLSVRPFAVVVGGVQYERVGHRDGVVGAGEAAQEIKDDREDRFVTLAMSRFGFLGEIGDHVSIRSEVEVNRGPHGTSVWEGQAALQVRDQRLRLSSGDFAIDLGRITDDATVDFTSAHVADQLLMDPYTQRTMLETGYNLGNGLKLLYGASAGGQADGLGLGVAFNASNPTSTTASYLVSGKYSSGLFTRLHRFAGSRVAASPNKYPDDATHITMLTPSASFHHDLFDAHGAAQLFSVNIDTNGTGDDPISGYNLRGGVRGRLFGGALTPFLNVARVIHTTLAYESDDTTSIWRGQDWHSVTVSGGVDLRVVGRHGVGVQVARTAAYQGDGTLVESADDYLNFGGTFWLADTVALGARYALWRSDRRDRKWNSSSFEWESTRFDEGESSLFFTLRKVL